jgi:hypothetical protein
MNKKMENKLDQILLSLTDAEREALANKLNDKGNA